MAVSERDLVKKLQAKVPPIPTEERLTLNEAADLIGVSSRAVERYTSRTWKNPPVLRLRTWRDPSSGRRYTSREYLREAELLRKDATIQTPTARRGRRAPVVAVAETPGEAVLMQVIRELQEENLRLRLRVAQLEADPAQGGLGA